MSSSQNHFALAWFSVAVFFAIDLIWFQLARLTFEPSFSFWLFVGCVLGLGATYLLLKGVSWRVRNDPTTIGTIILFVSQRSSLLVHVLIFNVALFDGFLVFTYLATSASLPLQDASLAAIDHGLGFEWLRLLAVANSSPVFSQILVAAYQTSGWQVLVLCVFLSLINRKDRLAEFLAVLSVSSLMTAIVSMLVPAAGAYVYYAPPPELFSNFSAKAGMWHYDLFLSLRVETSPVLDFANAQGLVTFPSFHTVLALTTAYGAREFRTVAVPVVVLNAIVIVSTLPEGGHYLVDLIAGAVLAVAATFLVRMYKGREVEPASVLRHILD